MKAEIALTYYEDIWLEHRRYETASRLEEIAKNIGRYSDGSDRKLLEKILSDARNLQHDLNEINYTDFLDKELLEFRESEINQYLGENLSEKIGAAVSDTREKVWLFHESMKNLHDKHVESLSTIRRFCLAFRALGIEAFRTPESPHRLCVVYFPQASLSDITLVKNNISELETFLSALKRSIGEPADSIEIAALATSQLKAYIQIGSTLAAALAATVSFSLDSYKSAIQIQLQMASLAIQEFEDEKWNNLEDIRGKIASSCATKLYYELSETGITANEMQLKATCRQVLSMIDKGFEFSLRVTSEDDVTAIDKIEAFTIENARRLTQLTAELAALREPRLMLENSTKPE
jgi:hypothetical protein